MRTETVKKIFWFFILFLPLQYAAVGIVGVLKSEPWPALVLPAFKSVFDQKSEIVIWEVRFLAARKDTAYSLKIEPSMFFNEIEESQLLGFLRTHFADSLQVHLSNAGKKWMKNRINQIYPLWKGSSLQVKWVAKHYQYADSKMQLKNIEIIKSFIIPLQRGHE